MHSVGHTLIIDTPAHRPAHTGHNTMTRHRMAIPHTELRRQARRERIIEVAGAIIVPALILTAGAIAHFL